MFDQLIIRTVHLKGRKPFTMTNVLVLHTGDAAGTDPISCFITQSRIKTPTPLELLTRRLLPSNIAPQIYLHECRGVPAASKGEEDSSSCSYLRACQRA